MGATSEIQWTDATWNPTVGCTKVSPGCDHCYAEGHVNRFAGTKGFPERFDTMVLRPHFLDLPLRWRRPRRVFVNSLSDLFHDDVPDEFIARVFAVMAETPQHTFQLLTKRHGRMRSLLSSAGFYELVDREWCGLSDWYWGRMRQNNPDGGGTGPGGRWPLPNVWLGISAEDQKTAGLRIPALLDTPAAIRWVSAEPLLGPLSLRWMARIDRTKLVNNEWDGLRGLDWIVVGGESGPGARPMHPDWARSIRDQCANASIPFFFKQWGAWVGHGRAGDPKGNGRDPWLERDVDAYINVATGQPSTTDGHGMWRVGKKAAGRELDGRTWDQYPEQSS